MNLYDSKTGDFIKWDGRIVFICGGLMYSTSKRLAPLPKMFGNVEVEKIPFNKISKYKISLVKKYLKYDLNMRGLDNLDYLEAIVKLKEYEKEKT